MTRDREAWRATRAAILVRQRHRCAVCRRLRALDVHHVVKRSQGGRDEADNLVGLCRACHDATDAPAGRGRRLSLRRGPEGWEGVWT